MNEVPRVLTMKDLKKEMADMLEYSDPHDPLTMATFPSNVKLSSGMKPLVGDDFFETDDATVAHLLKTDPLYALVKECDDEVLVVESFDEEELAPCTIYQGA